MAYDEECLPPYIRFIQHGSIDAGDETFEVEYYPQGLLDEPTIVETIEGGFTLHQVMVGRWHAEHGLPVPCEFGIFNEDESECFGEGRLT